jgi:hypothetical protein
VVPVSAVGVAVAVLVRVAAAVSDGVMDAVGVSLGSGVGVSVRFDVGVTSGVSVGVGDSGDTPSSVTIALISATLTRPSPLTSAVSQVLGAPNTMASTASISA